MVIVFMYLIMSKRLSAFTALVLVPVATALVLGFPSAEIGKWMIAGVRQTAPTAAMLLFAITFFGIMINAGLFDPVVSRILKIVKGDPMKVIVGTSLMAAFVSLDGDGSTTYMIVVTAMLPLYQKTRDQPDHSARHCNHAERHHERDSLGRTHCESHGGIKTGIRRTIYSSHSGYGCCYDLGAGLLLLFGAKKNVPGWVSPTWMT